MWNSEDGYDIKIKYIPYVHFLRREVGSKVNKPMNRSARIFRNSHDEFLFFSYSAIPMFYHLKTLFHKI